MFGDYNNLLVNVLDSISKWFTDLSCKTSEILDRNNSDVRPKSRAIQALYIMIGAFFMLLYGLYGIIKGLLCIISSMVRKENTPSYIKYKELFFVFTMCLALFFIPFLLSTNDYSQNINLYYYNNRKKINETCKYNLLPVNSYYAYYEDSYLYNLRNVLECTKTPQDVMAIRDFLKDDFPKELHFATVNDYLIMLLSLQQFELLNSCTSLPFFSNPSNNKYNARLFQYYLSMNCKDAFKFGHFYTSNKCLELKLRFANYNSITDDPHFNNSFYLMRLFNENILDRYLSSHHNNKLLYSIVSDVYNINKVFREAEFDTPISVHENEIIDYLNSVYVFNHYYENHKCTTNQFLRLCTNTESDILKQYSLNMALRSQYEYTYRLWEENNPEINQNLKILYDINIKCKKGITYPYLLNTLDLYTLNP